MGIPDRLASLRAALEGRGLDAFLVSSEHNRRYLSGFVGSAGYLLISGSEAVLATDFRYVEQAGQQAPDFRVERVGGRADWLPKLTAELGARRVGFESNDLTVAAHSSFLKAVRAAANGGGLRLFKTNDVVERIRAVKDPTELNLLQRAVDIADEALAEVAPTIEPGVTEAEVAVRLERSMRDRGAEGPSFDTIVAAGPNGALPHHRADDTVIQDGQAVVIDMGCIYKGYCSDLTRTVIVGSPDEKFKHVYNTVLRAQLAAEAAVKSGMGGQDVDAVARDIIKEAGHGEEFGHSLGHGVGLAVHEFPHVGPRAEDELEDGMIMTIEPGIYVPGWGGVRIEDMVVIENGRARVMTTSAKLELT